MSDKKFYLTKAEKADLLGRKLALDYLNALIQSDTQDFVNEVVKVRLNIKPEQKISVDIDAGIIQFVEDKKECIPVDKK